LKKLRFKNTSMNL